MSLPARRRVTNCGAVTSLVLAGADDCALSPWRALATAHERTREPTPRAALAAFQQEERI